VINILLGVTIDQEEKSTFRDAVLCMIYGDYVIGICTIFYLTRLWLSARDRACVIDFIFVSMRQEILRWYYNTFDIVWWSDCLISV